MEWWAKTRFASTANHLATLAQEQRICANHASSVFFTHLPPTNASTNAHQEQSKTKPCECATHAPLPARHASMKKPNASPAFVTSSYTKTNVTPNALNTIMPI